MFKQGFSISKAMPEINRAIIDLNKLQTLKITSKLLIVAFMKFGYLIHMFTYLKLVCKSPILLEDIFLLS